MNTLTVPDGGRKTVYTYIAIFGAVVVLMMLLGLVMRAAQGGTIALGPDLFYQIMTAHGVGMVGIAGLGGAAIMWYFLRQYVELYTGILIANLLLFLVGVVCILSAIFLGKFGGAWTFLFPLPGESMGAWSTGAAVLFLSGVLIIGVGFLLFYLDAGRALIAEYGSFSKSLGWPQLFGEDDGNAPPPTVVASTMVTIVNTLALVAGASILVMMIINLVIPSFNSKSFACKKFNLLFRTYFY